MSPDVKFLREIHPGYRGLDVISHKRCLSRWNPKVYPWGDFTDLAGKYFFDALVIYKKSKGLGIKRVLGGRTHEAMERTRKHGSKKEWAFDALAIRQAQQYWDAHSKSKEELIRERIVQAGFFWFNKRGGIAYSQFRPMQVGKPPWSASRWDCSGFYTVCCFAGGAPDPNGRGYDGLGYTGTLMSRGRRVSSISQLKPGDAIFYGNARRAPGFNAGDPSHVSLYVGHGRVLSLGSYPMKHFPFNYRSINHLRHYEMG